MENWYSKIEKCKKLQKSILGIGRYYIQSAFSIPDDEKRAQEIRPFTKINDSFKKIIITKDIVPAQYDNNGILTINIYDFLLNPSTLNQ